MTYKSVAQMADALTLSNRLERASQGSMPFSLYCLNFTDSSNRRGSERSFVNDQLLVNVANLTVALMGTQIIVAKTGKDRLEIVVPGLKKAEAIKGAGDLREKLEEQFCAKMPGLGVAFGLATHPTDPDQEYSLRDLATAGVDEATKLGQNRIFAAISAAQRAEG